MPEPIVTLVRSRSAGVALAVAAALALVSCGTDNDSADEPATARPTAPDTASFSGTPPAPLKSAASSASAAAEAFEASVSAEVERANRAAETELKDVEGQGNAMSDVSMTGMPRSETGGLLAVVVTITNKTDTTASYAAQVDFLDDSGKVVERRYVGAEDLEPGEKAQPLAVSRKPAEPVLTPKLAKAQRY
ncbi:FxLYD domain-containing protein [Streptomyces sp. AC555_RSS877]|uniref:FxLYD domain-containing protein n=1 Tax=Streptomyces sp. AC555_RSS877 TaxID=2823688 RepID=UPI001C2661FE|nr:FxLYD domain-containing protein [Streptomyces sp. AC555_RSS877]